MKRDRSPSLISLLPSLRVPWRLWAGFTAGLLAGLLSAAMLHGGNSQGSITVPSPDSAPSPSVTQSRLAITTDISRFGVSLESDSYIPTDLALSSSPLADARGVLGRDDRQPMLRSDFPWSAVGRLEGLRADGIYLSRCTGTLIAPDVVITNAHCVVSDRTHQPHQAMWFEPNLIDGALQTPTDRVTVVEAFYATDFRDESTANQQDWALLRLNRPMGERYGVLGWRSLPLDFFQTHPDAIALVGYSGDFPADNPGATAAVHSQCSIVAEIFDGFTHNCDSGSGASGAPLIGWVDGMPYLVAVHAGGRHDPHTNALTANYAVSLTHLKTRLLEAMGSS